MSGHAPLPKPDHRVYISTETYGFFDDEWVGDTPTSTARHEYINSFLEWVEERPNAILLDIKEEAKWRAAKSMISEGRARVTKEYFSYRVDQVYWGLFFQKLHATPAWPWSRAPENESDEGRSEEYDKLQQCLRRGEYYTCTKRSIIEPSPEDGDNLLFRWAPETPNLIQRKKAWSILFPSTSHPEGGPFEISVPKDFDFDYLVAGLGNSGLNWINATYCSASTQVAWRYKNTGVENEPGTVADLAKEPKFLIVGFSSGGKELDFDPNRSPNLKALKGVWEATIEWAESINTPQVIPLSDFLAAKYALLDIVRSDLCMPSRDTRLIGDVMEERKACEKQVQSILDKTSDVEHRIMHLCDWALSTK